ncbi:patatin-like phospholipase family protein [Myxococcota bacterium]|nr:patatin-like phospholipase family protein [Myxococcota bacterium]
MNRRRALAEIYAALDQARSYEQWLEAAAAHDRFTGADAWRAQDHSPHYDATLLRQERDRLHALRHQGDGLGLARQLDESLARHLGDITAPELYGRALTGTKHLVGAFLDEAEASLRWLVGADVPGVCAADKRLAFQRAWKVYGHSALMLSGGATWGFHHLGVVKALFERDLLPHILSGASTGAMIAAGICSRTDAEIAALFADIDQIRLDGLLRLPLVQALQQGAALDPDQLRAVLDHNVGPATFAQAFAHSGRVLAIAVSPTRTRQKSRLLCHLTSPDVLIASAAMASSALPGLFVPQVLHARDPDGTVRPWVPTERWADGSITADLPKMRLARLFNVNHFIASQTNPHVLPFVRHHGQRGLVPTIAGIAGASVRSQGALVTDLARRATRPSKGPVGRLADRAYNLVSQDYRGDIDIHPQLRPSMLGKLVVNPSRDDLAEFIAEGERAAWPKLAMIRDQTRLGRVFRACLAELSA